MRRRIVSSDARIWVLKIFIHLYITAGLAVTRLQTIMNTFLLRRKKDSMLDGKKLIELPEKEVKLVKLEFSKEEREIYQMVEARSQAKFNRYLREGTVLKYGIFSDSLFACT